MTPADIAACREWWAGIASTGGDFRQCQEEADDLLDEIERLQGLVAVHVEFDWHDNAWGGLSPMCRGCNATDDTKDASCESAMVAHVAEILDGAK